ncbi:MAG: MFS transporter [Deltaproteobacteria bacterium]|nr:MFS transporter [Deltaproteobacteria bacterium]
MPPTGTPTDVRSGSASHERWSRPDAPRSPFRRDFALLFVCLVSVGMGQSMLFSILPPASREIGITPFQVSMIFATSASLWVFVSPAWGRRSDRAGRRQVIIIGLLGYALSMSLLALVIDVGRNHLLPGVAVFPMMIAARCVFALLGSGTGPASQAYIADRTTRTERTAGVALVSAAMGLGETIGPGVGAALAVVGLLAPLYLSSALAVLSAVTIFFFLPEEEHHAQTQREAPRRMRVLDRRIRPFLAVSTALQSARGTTVVCLAFYLQDELGLDAERTAQIAGLGFVTLAVAGLLAQLVIVQRFRPSARSLMRSGVALMLAAFLLLILGTNLPVFPGGLALLGIGMGLVRPGSAAAASLSVEASEQGSAAGILGGVSVAGNVVGPLIGTSLYGLSHKAPFLVNAAMQAVVLIVVVTNRRVRQVRA